MRYRLLGKMAFREVLSGKRFICCALTIQYVIYSTVGRSIASIYDLGAHIYLSALRLDKYGTLRVWYIGYGLPYRTIFTYSVIGRSIADKYDLRCYIHRGMKQGKYATEIYHIPYGRKFWREDILADC